MRLRRFVAPALAGLLLATLTACGSGPTVSPPATGSRLAAARETLSPPAATASPTAAGTGSFAPASAPSSAPSTPTSRPEATSKPSARPTAIATPRPTQRPAPKPTAPAAVAAVSVAAWTTRSVAILAAASDDGAVQAHLGANFPLKLTSRAAKVDGATWYEAAWQTPGRHATGWLPGSAVTLRRPSGGASASFDALDTALAGYLAGFGARVGVQVTDVTRRVTYGYNQGRAYLVASSMKVPIMLALLSQLEAQGRRPSANELSLLTTMIENSNDASTSALYAEIGYQAGINAFMRSVGISGLSPQSPAVGWGWSTITPAAMVALLLRLEGGTILTAADRSLALNLMEHVESDQRVGAGDSSPAGATVALKDGWVPGPDGLWAMNTSGIVWVRGETYVISVYTADDSTLAAGYAIARHVCDVVGDRLAG